MRELTDYGKRVKCRLIELNQTQKWLEASINERTGLYMDRSYIGKILTGQLASPKVIAAINDILGFDNETEKAV